MEQVLASDETGRDEQSTLSLLQKLDVSIVNTCDVHCKMLKVRGFQPTHIFKSLYRNVVFSICIGTCLNSNLSRKPPLYLDYQKIPEIINF